MSHCLRAMVIALPGSVALLACATASAQPHTEARLEELITPTPAPDVWLRRLVGRFEFDGMISAGPCPPPAPEDGSSPPAPLCTAVKGTGDCIAVGTGPGVQCVLNVSWQDMFVVNSQDGKVYSLPGGVSYLDPAMLLFGLDPGKAAVNYLLVDNKGLPEGGLGTIAGNRGTFKTTCVNAPALFLEMAPPVPDNDQPLRYWQSCERIIYIDAKPDAKLLYLSVDINLNDAPFTHIVLSLRRVLQYERGTAEGLPSLQR
jgi:hypothetical protein